MASPSLRPVCCFSIIFSDCDDYQHNYDDYDDDHQHYHIGIYKNKYRVCFFSIIVSVMNIIMVKMTIMILMMITIST